MSDAITPLKTATTEELVQELRSRAEVLILAGRFKGDKEGAYIFRLEGDMIWRMGLASCLLDECRKGVGTTYSEDD